MYIRYYLLFRCASPVSEARGIITQSINDQDSLILVATVSGQTAGFVRILPVRLKGERWYIQDLWVERACRRHGVAAALVEQVGQLAREADALWLTADVAEQNPPAQALMKKLGFTCVGRDDIMLMWARKVWGEGQCHLGGEYRSDHSGFEARPIMSRYGKQGRSAAHTP